MHRLIGFCACLPATAAFSADVPPATKIALSNGFEIDTRQLALKCNKSADGKASAQQMIHDHKKAGADFKVIPLFTMEKAFDL